MSGHQQPASQQRSLSQNRDIFSSGQNQSQGRDVFSIQNQSQNREIVSNQNQNRELYSSQNQGQSSELILNQNQHQSQSQGREQGLFSQQSSISNQTSSFNSNSFSSSSEQTSSSQVEKSFSSEVYQQSSGLPATGHRQEIFEKVENSASTNTFESVQSVSSEQRQSFRIDSGQSSEKSKFSSVDQKSSSQKFSYDGQMSSIGNESSPDVSSADVSSIGNVSSPYNLPPQVSARSLISELEATPSPLLINNNNNGNNNNNTNPPTMPSSATPWSAATFTNSAGPELILSSPASQPLNLPMGGLEQPNTNSPASSSGFQLQRPRQFQPSPATVRRILSPSSPSPAPQKSSPAPPKSSPAPKRNSPGATTSSSSDLATVQFGQQKEVKFNSVSNTNEQRRVMMESDVEAKESQSGSSRDSKSKSKEVQSGQLAHAICNMTETLASFKVYSSPSPSPSPPLSS